MKYIATVDGEEFLIGLTDSGVTLGGVPQEIDLESIDGGFHYSLLASDASHEVFVERCEDVCFVTLGDQRFRVQVEDERARQAGEQRTTIEEAGAAEVVSPMPGVIVAVLVEPGKDVRTGEALLILEAMKMENEIRSPRTGIIEAVHVTPGQRVSQNEVLLQFGPRVGLAM